MTAVAWECWVCEGGFETGAGSSIGKGFARYAPVGNFGEPRTVRSRCSVLPLAALLIGDHRSSRSPAPTAATRLTAAGRPRSPNSRSCSKLTLATSVARPDQLRRRRSTRSIGQLSVCYGGGPTPSLRSGHRPFGQRAFARANACREVNHVPPPRWRRRQSFSSASLPRTRAWPRHRP